MAKYRVRRTARAIQQSDGLRGVDRKRLDAFLQELSSGGCRALGYRLTGDGLVGRFCVKHPRGSMRAVVGFASPVEIWLLLVGPHDQDPGIDVYTELYRLVGYKPPDNQKRTKPSCCGTDGLPPSTEELTELVERAVAARRVIRR